MKKLAIVIFVFWAIESLAYEDVADLAERFRVVGVISTPDQEKSIAVIRDSQTEQTITVKNGNRLADDIEYKVVEIQKGVVTISRGEEDIRLTYGALERTPEDEEVEDESQRDHYIDLDQFAEDGVTFHVIDREKLSEEDELLPVIDRMDMETLREKIEQKLLEMNDDIQNSLDEEVEFEEEINEEYVEDGLEEEEEFETNEQDDSLEEQDDIDDQDTEEE